MAFPVSDATLLTRALYFTWLKDREQCHDAHASLLLNRRVVALHWATRSSPSTDVKTLVALVLHDVLVRTATQPDEIERNFGPEVRALVEEVTVPPGLAWPAGRQWQLDILRTATHGARFISLADELANLHRLPATWTPAQRATYLDWAEQVGVVLRGTDPRLEAIFATALTRAREKPYRAPSAPRARVPTDSPSPRPGPATVHECLCRQIAPLLRQWQALMRGAGGKITSAIAMLEERSDGQATTSAPATDDSRAARRTEPRTRKWTHPRFKEQAKMGVKSLKLRRATDGGFFVSVDGGAEFRIPPVLAHLLAILAFAEGPGDDGFPPFQSLEEVAAALAKRTGRAARKHAVTMAICRLRVLLYDHHVPPLLVESSVKRGARFRLNRG